MNDEYISREAVLKTLQKANIGGYITERLLEIPAADVQPVAHGYWKECKIRGTLTQSCSLCGNDCGVLYPYNFCPNCGARMDGKKATLTERCSNYIDCDGNCFIGDTPCDCGGNIEKCKGR